MIGEIRMSGNYEKNPKSFECDNSKILDDILKTQDEELKAFFSWWNEIKRKWIWSC